MEEILITKTRLIAVEGKDEVNFVKALFNYLSIHNVQVIDLEGKDNFKRIIPALINTPGFDKVIKFGIVRDADDDSRGALKSVQSALANAGLAQPQNTNEFAGENPSIRIFIMPGNKEEGMLEDLCLQSIQESPELTCIDNFFECVGSSEIKNFSKAKVQAYLSTKPKSINTLGVGAQNGYWNFDHTCFEEFTDFLKGFS